MSISFLRISKSKLRLVASLKQKKVRKEMKLFVAEGEKCVIDTIGSFRLEMLVATTHWLESHSDFIASFHKELGSNIFSASSEDMRRMSSLSTPPDVIAVYRQPIQSYEAWHKDINDRLSLMLDGVQDPGNLGTIIRAADWFGVHYIAASPETADLYNAKTIQATMGAISRVKMIYMDLEKIVDEHPDLPVYGTLLDGDDIFASPLNNKGFIVFGSEGHGISEAMRRRITKALLIPSYPPGENTSESLNVAIATAITLAEFRRRLLQ